MAFTKITEADLTGKGVVGLPDTPGLSTTEMQEKFDEIANDVLVPKHNVLIDELEDSTGADSIGAKDINGNASTVQNEFDERYAKSEINVLLSNKVDKEDGKGLSTFDFSTAYKDKLNGIEDNANNYVLPKGTQSEIGGVMGDGSTFTIDENGVGHAIGGGGGGTADYTALINKPKLNGSTLIGDKQSEDYGILRPYLVITSEAGSTVKIKKGTTEIVATQKTSTTWEVCPTSYGTWTVTSELSGADIASDTIIIDAVKTYAITVNHITATITASYPVGATYCKCYKGSTEYVAISNPHTFTVRSKGTWTLETELNGIVKTASATISADGDSQSVSIEYADITVTYDNNFKGKTITCTDGTTTYTATAPSDSNSVSFTIPSLGTWTVSATVSGTPYTDSVTVSEYTSYPATLALFNATITATFPSGATCTCDGVTASTSPYTFNIGQTGTYSVVCTLDGISQTDSVVITTDGQTETCDFEFGTINLTFDNEFRGQTITATDGVSTITKTAPISGNTMVLYPNATGNWTVSGVYSGTTYVSSPNPVVVSSLSTPVSAILQTIPDGSTATPTDVIQTWLKCATINDKSYTTLNEVLADTDTFTALLQDSNACDYMARSTTWSTDICADADAMRRVGMYDYCSNALLSDDTWLTAIINSTYIDSVLNISVPVMTSNTTPSGTCSASTQQSGYDAYRAFNNNASSAWSATATSNQWLQYAFPSSIKCYCAFMRAFNTGNSRVKNYTIQGSKDNSTFTDVTETLTCTQAQDTSYGNASALQIIKFTKNLDDYTQYRISVVSAYESNINIGITLLNFYGRAEAQTNIIHSGASDTLYYNNGSSQTIGTTDTSGVGTVNWSNLPVGNLTIYSTVANDPDDLTSAYSKTVRITPHTTEVYVMPNNALYWWGYASADLEDISSDNGWTFGTGYTTLTPVAPTKTTNYIDMNASTSQISGVGGKNNITPRKIRSIVEGVRVSSNEYGQMHFNSTKQLSTSYTTRTTITAGTPTLLSTDESTSGYFSIYANNNRQSKLYALWYE